MSIGIYTITCRRTGKFYIGSSQELKQRQMHHWSMLRAGKNGSLGLQSDWDLYEEDDFVFEVIESCAIQDLSAREQHHIDLHWESGLLYNIDKTARRWGSSSRRRSHSAETRRKISMKLKGQTRSAQQRRNISEGGKRSMTPERLKMQSEACTTRRPCYGLKLKQKLLKGEAPPTQGDWIRFESRGAASDATWPELEGTANVWINAIGSPANDAFNYQAVVGGVTYTCAAEGCS